MNGNDPRQNGNYSGHGNQSEVNPVYDFDSPYDSSHGSGNNQVYEEVTPDAVWDAAPKGRNNGEPFRRNQSVSADRFFGINQSVRNAVNHSSPLGIVGTLASALSVVLSLLALILTWLFYVGFIINIISAVFSVAGIVLGAIGGGINAHRGYTMGAANIAAIVLGAAALLLSGLVFTCTGCAACFFCSGAASKTLF